MVRHWNLGFIVNFNLSFSKHISSLSSTCHYHIRDLRRIRHTLDFTTAATIATSLVHSRPDCFNSLYHGLPLTQIKRIQQIQNALAALLLNIPTLLPQLHWIKIEQRIHNKIISITNNLHSSQAQYLHKLNVKPTGKTRSSAYLCLSLPPLTSKLKFSNSSFRISAPHLWNSLPPNLRTYAPVSDKTITNITNITRSSVSPTFKLLYLYRIVFFHTLKPTSSPFHFPP